LTCNTSSAIILLHSSVSPLEQVVQNRPLHRNGTLLI